MLHESAPAGTKPLRVLMVLESNFTQKGGGGAESQLRTLALALKRAGQRVAIMTPLTAQGPQITAERCYGLPVARVSYPRRKLIGAGIMNLKFGAFLLRNRDRYDAWHVHIGHNMGAITCLLGAWLNKPVVVKISGWWELEAGLLAPNRGFFGRMAKSWLKRATAVQAISTRVAAELEKSGFPREKIVVLPNAVDTSRFRVCAARREAGQPFSAVFVGRLVPEKDLATLMTAWGQAFAGRKDVKLRLVGGGPLEKELRARAEELGIAHQVELLGHRDHVEEVLAQSHVGLLTSRIEGLSNTLLEFLACGLPAIASRVSGSEDFVKPGRNGWLFDVGDVAQLARCLREAEATAPDRLAELGQNARADVVAEASLPRVLGRLMQLYRGQLQETR
jgi:glycosyltransferase involved in cell wall biosynthesis